MKNKKFFKFSEPNFENLMAKRIYRILLVCSPYDAFMLEEDGRINEIIFQEYTSLNLRYPPEFIRVSTAKDAFEILKNSDIDLVISMLSIGDMDPIGLAKTIKTKYTHIPIVLLTPFSRLITEKIYKGDLKTIDYIFSWLGDTDILLSIIKLIEDKMNVENDVRQAGVQVILLVEDSIRFYSSYLPLLYKILFEHSKHLEKDVLNEHQKMLRKRARPKVLLATTYEQAMDLFMKYKKNLLGIISDIGFPKNGKRYPLAGIEFAKKVLEFDKYLPFVLQSSDIENKKYAQQLDVGFIYKNSPRLLFDLQVFVDKYFGFGDFIFKYPDTKQEILRVSDLKTMQYKIYEVPEVSLIYHLKRNHLSRWLKARGVFSLADFLAQYTIEEFEDLDQVRKFVSQSIKRFRKSESRTVIAKFDKNNYDEFVSFARIGDGMLGGKARGLAFLNYLIEKTDDFEQFENVSVSIPRTVVLTTDIFDKFIQQNNLIEIALSDASDYEILKKFVEAELPSELNSIFLKFIQVIKRPIAVRSSSLLEDAHYQPFAGVYSTYMIPKYEDDFKTLVVLKKAIKSVYASVYFAESKAYMKATSHVIDREKMAIVLQEVCGSRYGERFYPIISGVARSINYYPIGREKPEDGIVNLAFGLGKQIVEGETSLRYSPSNPQAILQLTDPQTALRQTQKTFYALDLSKTDFELSTDDAITLNKYPIREAEKDGTLDLVASVYDFQNDIIRDGLFFKGKKIITFNPILKYNKLPINDIIKLSLEVGRRSMNLPVEIEFAVNICKNNSKANFSLLQIRPIVSPTETVVEDLNSVDKKDTIIYSEQALGNGSLRLYDLVYVRQDNYNPKNNKLIANELKELNEQLLDQERFYVLIGPGRWGSRDPWLGIPVKWAYISAARVIVEAGLENYRIEPSQGTHFFQNLTSFRVAYITVNPYIKDGYYDIDFLNEQQAVYQTEYIKHIRFNTPIEVKINGRKQTGVIFKPKN